MRNTPLAAAETIELSPLAEAAIAAIEGFKQILFPDRDQIMITFLGNAADRIRTQQVDVHDIFSDGTFEKFQDQQYVMQCVWAYEAHMMAGG